MKGRRYSCARCGTKRAATAFTYSRFTRRHYCLDTAQCEQRHLRLKALGKIDARGFVKV